MNNIWVRAETWQGLKYTSQECLLQVSLNSQAWKEQKREDLCLCRREEVSGWDPTAVFQLLGLFSLGKSQPIFFYLHFIVHIFCVVIKSNPLIHLESVIGSVTFFSIIMPISGHKTEIKNDFSRHDVFPSHLLRIAWICSLFLSVFRIDWTRKVKWKCNQKCTNENVSFLQFLENCEV